MYQSQMPTDLELLTTEEFQNTVHQATEMWTYSLIKHANLLAHLLIAKKQLPSFYFIDAAAEIGIAPQACRYLKLNTWPIAPQRTQTKLSDISQILSKVYLRIAQYQHPDTYPQAVAQLQYRIDELRHKGISHNRTAQHLRISYKTLKDIARPPKGITARPRHCPWALLHKLKHAEDDIDTSVHYRVSADPTLRSRSENQTYELPPNESEITPIDSPCSNCGATPTHLYENGYNAWGNIIRTCRLCSKDTYSAPQQLIDSDPDAPSTHDIIERYAPCWRCGGPWHNLTKTGTDDLGYTTYSCLLCSELSRLPPKQAQPPTKDKPSS